MDEEMPGRGFSCPPVSAYPGHHSLPLPELLLLVILTSVRGMGHNRAQHFVDIIPSPPLLIAH